MRDQLLVRSEAMLDPRVRGLINALGLTEAPLVTTSEASGSQPESEASRTADDLLAQRVVRLDGPTGSMKIMAEMATTLRRQGLPVSANYVTPMGGFIKSIAGPDPTAGAAPDFPRALVPANGQQPTVRVAVIDTGFYPHHGQYAWLSNLPLGTNKEDLNSRPEDNFLDFAAGHGTFCTGIVQQVAPEAEIVIYKALRSDGFADEVGVARAIILAALDGLADGQDVIITLSLGTETADDERPVALGAALEIVDELAAEAEREVLVVAAAGNYGRDRPCYPAAFPTVLAVAAVTQALLPADWSSRGAWVDVCTIGEGVRSTFVPGEQSPLFDLVKDRFPVDAWALWTGTSFAAPQVAGAIAKLAIIGGLRPSAARRTLLKGAVDVPLYGKRIEILPSIKAASERT